MAKRPTTEQERANWQAQREARTQTLLAELEAGIQAIQTSEDFKRYLATAAKFHAYSFNNVLLILAQRADATRVASYKAWQALAGRCARASRRSTSLPPARTV